MKKLGASSLLAAVVSLILASAAFAQQGQQTSFAAQLAPLNGSGASGTATVTVNGNQATVNIQSAGLAPGQAHAQHIHIGGQFICAPPSADIDRSGAVSSAEGEPFIGPIRVSLTTWGDVSAASALAVQRFPVANADGSLAYSRTFTLPAGITAADLEGGSIEQHGIDFNANGVYDFDAGVSSLDPSLPFEATVPAACGELASMMTGTASPAASPTASPTARPSPAAGGLPATGGTSLVLPAAVALVVSGGIALALVRRRRVS